MNKRNALTITPLLLCVSIAAAADDVEKLDLFVAGQGGYAVYRIPGLVSLNGTVLAYCEARKNGAADWGQIDVLLRRSTDAGRTWDAPRKVVTPPPDARQTPASTKRKPGEITVNNPVAVADPARDVVCLLWCVEYGRCFVARSADRGLTFGAPVEITATFERFRPAYDWRVIATGPGHGVVLQSGRLVVPVWLSTSTQGPHRPSCVATIYSDDGGKTWERGDIVPAPGLVNPSETAVAQVHGTVVLNIRHEGEPHLRAVVTGRDGATGWGKVRLDPALPEPVCMGSLLTLGNPGDRRANRLLFCNPNNPDGRERKNLSVRLTIDRGRTWTAPRTLEPGPSGYSDMTTAGRGVLCLYERQGTLTLARFTESWVTGR
jgi:sialidase-1